MNYSTQQNLKPTSKIILFWAIIVTANSLYGAYLFIQIGQDKHPLAIFGMILAIISCIVIYSCIEIILRKKNKNKLAKELRISAGIRILLQPISDLFIGAVSVGAARFILNQKSSGDLPTGFFSIYLTTMIHAFLASLLVLIILGIVKLSIHCYQSLKA